MKTFEILQEFRALEELLNEFDPETGEILNSEEDIKDYVLNLSNEKSVKLDNIEDLKREYAGQIATIKEKVAKLQSKIKTFENKIDSLKELQLMLLDGEKFKTAENNFYFTKSKSVYVEDWFLPQLDDKFKKVTVTPNKTELKKAIKSGEVFEGVGIEEKTSLVVR